MTVSLCNPHNSRLVVIHYRGREIAYTLFREQQLMYTRGCTLIRARLTVTVTILFTSRSTLRFNREYARFSSRSARHCASSTDNSKPRQRTSTDSDLSVNGSDTGRLDYSDRMTVRRVLCVFTSSTSPRGGIVSNTPTCAVSPPTLVRGCVLLHIPRREFRRLILFGEHHRAYACYRQPVTQRENL